jgi:2-aminoethylphosphonate-pyruvate transaminase
MKTEVVVLAAGRGARLGSRGAETPKWLLDVGGEVIADRQLEALIGADRAAPGRIGAVRVVTGHAAGEIDRFLGHRSELAVQTLFNPEYERLNNWYSVLLALRGRSPEAESVAIVNSDLYAGSEWFGRFFAEAISTDRESLIGVDLTRALTDESMKVAAANRSEPGALTLTAIGKTGVSDPVGEYVGLLMARGEVLRRLQESLESFVERPEMANAWYEHAVGETAAAGAPWWIWPTPSSRWVEIDDDSDYAAAVEMTAGA